MNTRWFNEKDPIYWSWSDLADCATFSDLSFWVMISTTGVTKAVVCAILSGMMHIKEPLLLIGKSSPCGGIGFPLSLSRYLNGPLPYVWRHITVNKIFPSFLLGHDMPFYHGSAYKHPLMLLETLGLSSITKYSDKMFMYSNSFSKQNKHWL